MTQYAALIGIDWADTKHDICLIETATGQPKAAILRHSSKNIDEWATALHVRFNGQPIAVCLEQSRGPLIFALMKYDFLTLYPINPSTLAKYRQAFSPSRHKDDAVDGRLPSRTPLASPRAFARLAARLRADAHASLFG